MTQAEGVQLAISAIGNRKTTAHDYTNPYGAQCLALIAWYTDELGYASIMPGYNAMDVYTANPLNLEKPSSPKPGDMHFMDYWAYDESIGRNRNFGHTGVVIEVTATGVYSVDQNWFNASLERGSPAAKVFHPFNVMRGYLRPRFKEDDMKTDIGMVRQMAQTVGGRIGMGGRPGMLNGSDLAGHVGFDAGQEFTNWYWSPEGKAYRDEWLPAVVRFWETYKDRVAELSARPTKQQLEQLVAEMNQQAVAAQLATDQLNAITAERNALKADKDESLKVGERVLQWLGGLFKSSR